MQATVRRPRLLLHGVTGSGKTEVYLRAAAAALERGRAAIVLVPEIALTPQTAGRFVERFGDTVAVLHSALTARERFDEWRACARATARGLRGPALGGVRPAHRRRADRGRRGARRLLQAGGRPALRRPPRGRAARGRRAGAVLLARQRHAAARRASTRYARLDAARARRRPPAAAGRAGRHGRVSRRRCTSAPATRWTEVRARRREGDRAAQPARLVELPDLPRRAAGCGSARAAT